PNIGGAIDVTANALSLSANGGTARIGVEASNFAAQVTGNINVDATAIALSSSNDGTAAIGSRSAGSIDSDIQVVGGEGIALSSSDANSSSRIGNYASGNIAGSIDVSSDGLIGLSASDDAGATIGSWSFGQVDGDISVNGGGGVALSASGTNSDTRIGHGA